MNVMVVVVVMGGVYCGRSLSFDLWTVSFLHVTHFRVVVLLHGRAWLRR
jgi:hypothetical protein